jgi:hypothetical protein
VREVGVFKEGKQGVCKKLNKIQSLRMMLRLVAGDCSPLVGRLVIGESSPLVGGVTWGDEKEVPLVLKVDPIFIPFKFYFFKNNKLTIL